MADVEIKYTFKVPDEPYINDFSGGKTKEFTYIGPDKLTVTCPDDRNGYTSPYTQSLDGPVYDGEITEVIDVVANPELLPIADLFWGRQYDHEATFDEVTLEDGTKYQEQNNMTIHDYYWKPRGELNEDGTFKRWILDDDNVAVLEMFERDALSPKQRTYLAKADMFIEILDQFDLPDDEAAQLTAYKTAVETYRSKTSLPWKYVDVNPNDATAPKMPMQLVTRRNEIKAAGLENLQKEDDPLEGQPVYSGGINHEGD